MYNYSVCSYITYKSIMSQYKKNLTFKTEKEWNLINVPIKLYSLWVNLWIWLRAIDVFRQRHQKHCFYLLSLKQKQKILDKKGKRKNKFCWRVWWHVWHKTNGRLRIHEKPYMLLERKPIKEYTHKKCSIPFFFVVFISAFLCCLVCVWWWWFVWYPNQSNPYAFFFLHIS